MNVTELITNFFVTQERIAKALEQLVEVNTKSAALAQSMHDNMKNGVELIPGTVEQTATDTHVKSDGAGSANASADLLAATEAAQKAEQAAQAKKKAEAAAVAKKKAEAAAAEQAKIDKANAEAAEEAARVAAELEAALGEETTKVKVPSVDECRDSLKVFAAANGNEAAMKLLGSLGAKSVSALEEGKRQQLVDACKA